MKYKSEDRVKILEYKFIFEEEIQVKKEYEEGSTDLNYRLSFFRSKLDNSENKTDQKDLYDKMFMGGTPKVDQKSIEKLHSDNQKVTESAFKPKDNVKPWAKKIYRQIVMVTHPDKTIEIQSKHFRDQLCNQYRITQNAYKKEVYSDLIMVAFDLNIEVPELVINEHISPSLNKKKKNILQTKSLLGWQWYQVPENQKDAELKKILTQLGFKFTDRDVEEVVKRKYIKRKVGTKPKKMNVKRRKLK